MLNIAKEKWVLSNLDFIRAYLILNKNASFATAENNHVIFVGSKVIRTKTLEKLASKIRQLK